MLYEVITDDYDDEGFLKDEVKQEYEDKYSELDHT